MHRSLRSLAALLTNSIKNLNEWFDQLPEPIKHQTNNTIKNIKKTVTQAESDIIPLRKAENTIGNE